MGDKKERFKRIAAARTNKILDMLRLLGNCGNQSNYSYTEDEVQKIFKAIDKSVSEMKSNYFNDKSGKDRFVL